MKVLVQSAFNSHTGYGNDGLGLVMALQRWGCDVRLLPTNAQPPWPQSVAMLMTKPLDPPFDLHISHQPPFMLDLTESARAAADFRLAWTMWEFSNFDNLEAKLQAGMERRLHNFDLIAGYDEVSCGALREMTDRPVGALQGGFDPSPWEPVTTRDWSGTLRFIMVGQLHDRKQPFKAIEAFNILKARHGVAFDAELHLKTNTPGLHPKMAEAYPGIKIFYEHWPAQRLKEFYAESHVLLAPSMGEGKNVPALEFQSTGGVVIVSDFGGHQSWLHPSYSYALPVELAPPFGDRPRCLAAKVDPEQLADLMWHVYTHRAEAKDKGRLASVVIPQQCNWDAVVERLWDRTAEWCGEAGFMVKIKAQACHRELVTT